MDTDHAGRVRAVLDEHIADGRLAAPYYAEADVVAVLAELDQARAALADVDMHFRLPVGGGWCACCRLPMREGRHVVKTLAVVCEPCASDLSAMAGRLDPSRLAARKAAELATRDERDGGN